MRKLLLFNLALLVMVFSFYFARASRYSYERVYQRVNKWLKSAECSQQHKTFLAVCDENGKLLGIEDYYLTDDRGHTLLANIIAMCKSEKVSKTSLVRLNFSINALALCLLFFLIWKQKLLWTFFLGGIVATFAIIPSPYPNADVPTSFGGIYCLALIPIVWWTGELSKPNIGKGRLLAGGVASFFFLFWAVLLRHSIGIIGVSCCFYLIIFLFVREKNKNWSRILSYASVILMIYASLWGTSLLIKLRNSIYGISSRYNQNYAISHILYIGLGTEPNPWGIEWSDGNAVKAVHEKKPSIVNFSPEYNREIGNKYIEIVKNDARNVARIYWKKLTKTLNIMMFAKLQATESKRWIFALLLIFAVLTIIWYFFRIAESHQKTPIYLALHLGMTVCAFISIGVLAYPVQEYIYPAYLGILLILLCLVDFCWRFWNKTITEKVSPDFFGEMLSCFSEENNATESQC